MRVKARRSGLFRGLADAVAVDGDEPQPGIVDDEERIELERSRFVDVEFEHILDLGMGRNRDAFVVLRTEAAIGPSRSRHVEQPPRLGRLVANADGQRDELAARLRPEVDVGRDRDRFAAGRRGEFSIPIDAEPADDRRGEDRHGDFAILHHG